MTNQLTNRATDHEKAIEFIPYGAADKIKLSVKIIQNMVAVPTKSGAVCTERDALRFLMLCQSQRLNPFAGDAFLIGYDGRNGAQFSLITAHQAFLKRAETCQDYEGMESGVILLLEDGTTLEREGDFYLEGEEVVGGWARVHRKGRRDTYRRLRLSRFNKGFGVWQEDAAGMIVKVAEADALRSTFPTLLGGLYLQGETDASRIVSDIATTKPIFDPPPAREITPKENSGFEYRKSVTAEDLERVKDANTAEGTDLGPEKEKPNTQNVVKAVLGLLKLANVGEVELMEFLHGSQKVDESIGTVREMGKVAEATLKDVHDRWAWYLGEIKGVKEAK